MLDSIILLAAIGMATGTVVFLITETDFIYEYLGLLTKIGRMERVRKFLKFDFYENGGRTIGSTYVKFLGNFYGCRENAPFTIFLCKLSSCFICLGTFLSLIIGVAMAPKMGFLLFLCPLFSSIGFFVIWKIREEVFKDEPRRMGK